MVSMQAPLKRCLRQPQQCCYWRCWWESVRYGPSSECMHYATCILLLTVTHLLPCTAECQAIQGEQQHDVTVTCGLAAEKLCHSVLPQYLTTVPCHSALSQCLITGSYHSVLSQRVINLSYHSPLSQCLITVPYHSRLLPCVLPSANVWSP